MPAADSWKSLVLRSMPAPAWLDQVAPDHDVVVSSRARYARNVAGFAFAHRLSPPELIQVRDRLKAAIKASWTSARLFEPLTDTEFDFLVGSRLVSPDFPYREPGRLVALDEFGLMAAMVNEEDHLRLQALTAGLSVREAVATVQPTIERWEAEVGFAVADEWGYLTASSTNVGQGRRVSALFHLIGLAQAGRLGAVLTALQAQGLETRGLYGEASRAIGAFFQVSLRNGSLPEFEGACDYVLRQERAARREISRKALAEAAEASTQYLIGAREVSLAESLKALAWLRWAASVEIDGVGFSARQVDRWLSVLEVRGATDDNAAARQRAAYLRSCLEEPAR